MLTNYLKVACKVLLRRKFYTAVNLFGIAFTLLILIVCAALLDNTLAPGAPETRLDRILTIEHAEMSGPNNSSMGNPGYRLLDSYARDLPGVEQFSISTNMNTVTSFIDGEKVESQMRRTDGAFWKILEFEFIEGGPFTSVDDENGNFVAVINETTRERFFEGEAALGRTLRADGQTFTVIGVVPDVPIMRKTTFADVWTPIGASKTTAYRDGMLGGFQGVLLAERRAAFPEIKQEFRRRLETAELPRPDIFETLESDAYTRLEMIAREVLGVYEFEAAPTARFGLVAVLAVVAFMLLPALNLINLSLSRMLERSSEIGVRKAFGASSLSLVGQFLVENVVLTLVGGLIGLLLSLVALKVVGESGFIPYAELSFSVRVFLAGLGLSLLFAVLSGVYPAWRMSRLHPVEALHGRAA
jgi:putative ABC transport system permease protein